MNTNTWFRLSPLLLVLCLGAVVSCSDDGASGASESEDESGRPNRPGVDEEEGDDAEEGADADENAQDDAADAGDSPDDISNADSSSSLCEPSWLGCVNGTTIGQCSTDGTQLFETPCEAGTYCVNNNGVCTPGTCEPYMQRCAGTAGDREVCNADASGWGPTGACGPEEYCDDGRCLVRGCLPSVMFAFDGSSSMTSEFTTIQASINRITSANPDVAFGLSMFPTALGCTVGGDGTGLFGGGTVIDWPHVPISPSGAEQINEWFSNNDASAGATPLIATLEWFADNVTEVWGAFPENGHLVIMSEGADTCRSACEQDDRDFSGEERVQCLTDYLGDATRRLRDQGVKVYVIGYLFSEDPRILNSIAENGGTPFTEFIYAGSEDSLFAAFESVIGNAKICDE